jgi:hypothetical protein
MCVVWYKAVGQRNGTNGRNQSRPPYRGRGIDGRDQPTSPPAPPRPGPLVRRLLAHRLPAAAAAGFLRCPLPLPRPRLTNQPAAAGWDCRRRRTIKPARPAPAQLASSSGATTTAPPRRGHGLGFPRPWSGTATPTEEAGRRRIRATRPLSRDSRSPSRACWAPAGWWSPTLSSPTSPSYTSTAASRTPPATAPRRCSAGTGNHLTVPHNFFDSDTLYLSNSTFSPGCRLVSRGINQLVSLLL